MGSELPQQLSAKCVNRPAFDALRAGCELSLETRGDLAGSLVGECENADALRIESALLDQEPDSLDQAKGLAGTGTGKNENWLRASLNGFTL